MASKSPPKAVPKWVVGLVSALFGLAVFIGGIYGFYAISYRNLILPNTLVGDVAVSGLRPDVASVKILNALHRFENEPLKFTVADKPVTLAVADIGASYDADATVEVAYQLGREGTVWSNILIQLRALIVPTSVPLTVSYNKASLDQYLQKLSDRFDDPEKNAGVDFQRGKLVITDAKAGRRFNRALLKEAIVQTITTATPPTDATSFPLSDFEPTVSREQAETLLPLITSVVSTPLTLVFDDQKFTVNEDRLTSWLKLNDEAAGSAPSQEGFFQPANGAIVNFDKTTILRYVKTLASQLNQDPVDAKLAIVDGKASVFQASHDGRTLNETKTVDAIVALLRDRRTKAQLNQTIDAKPVTLVVSVTKPTVTSGTVDKLGIKELIGKGTTDFSGSPDNRVHNIQNGVKFLNGWLIKPGDELSTVKALGTVDGSTGYLPELVIKEDKTIPEFGGGLCQVSTTLFRAVLNAGLPVTDRQNHSYRVVYYERGVGPGLDATVYLPKPDFKFRNDTPGWLLIQGEVKGNTLTFEIYGTSDGRTTSIDGPHTLSTTPAPPDEYTVSNDLSPGETKLVSKAHEGATTIATYTVTRDGQVINQQEFRSKYKAMAAQYLKGPDSSPSSN